MVSTSGKMHLKVQQVEQVCIFELSWQQGQRLTARLNYPSELTRLYQVWRQAYLHYYTTAPLPVALNPDPQLPLRARVTASGHTQVQPADARAALVQAEAELISVFQHWLHSAELYEIRRQIAQGQPERERSGPQPPTELLLTCTPLALARLPWEVWEIGTEFAATGTIRMVRTPETIRAGTGPAPHVPRRRRRPRILMLLGDGTRLSIQADQDAVRSLMQEAEIHCVGWQPGQPLPELMTQIRAALSDQQGWDVLFFAGHSDETPITGGELAIAPQVSIQMTEIAPQLTAARERGLRFALFNSCSGLSLAKTLIDLGFSQVIVMREPIHDHVAQVFLLLLLQHLRAHRDVHDALLRACRVLKEEYKLPYPSAYLTPALFGHPDAPLFHLKPFGLLQHLQQWLPTRREAMTVGALVLLSLLPPVQDLLLEPRLGLQAIYRDWTQQVPVGSPPTHLVPVDEVAIRELDARQINPIDRDFLARLINRVQALKPKVIGVDFLLDHPTTEDHHLQAAVRHAVRQGTWFVFAARETAAGGEVGVTSSVADRAWVLQGYIDAVPWYVELPPDPERCRSACPFAYLLALSQTLNRELPAQLPQPHLDSPSQFRTQLLSFLNQQSRSGGQIATLRQLQLRPLTRFSHSWGQMWLHPILDFSLPPDRVYSRVTASTVLADSDRSPLDGPFSPLVLIAPGGYAQAGVDRPGEDRFAVPLAIAYWRQRSPGTESLQGFTGAEAHAYMIHHLLEQHLVIPIPDLWLVGVAALLGKGLALRLTGQVPRQRWAIAALGATATYGLLGLQVYVSAALLLPWALPALTLWLYLIPALQSGKANA